ncbi:MAG: DUF1330 domain-containing protein [Pseudomonadales bacterium]|jgi:uncharacterized protein (DUF1330 family)
MPHYLIAKINITDRERYSQYETGFKEIFDRFEGKFLAMDEDVKVLEGDWPVTRTVLIEFPSQATALDWYSSDDYQQLAKHRFAASEADIVIIQGLG